MSLNVNFSMPEMYEVEKQIFDDQLFRKLLIQVANDKNANFYQSFHQKEDLILCQEIANKHRDKKYFIHVGIGGSSLGPQMLISALPKNPQKQFVFIDNIDPDEIKESLIDIAPEEAVVFVVSKSGSTAETIAHLMIIEDWLLNNGISYSEFKKHLVIATDPVKSELHIVKEQWGIDLLSVPTNVGGRFSVISSVGFFPLCHLGINPEKLVAGAIQWQNSLLNEISPQTMNPTVPEKIEQLKKDHPFFETVNFLYFLKKHAGINLTVLMPYSSKLKILSNWFTQLWSESLGKKENIHGEVVFEGMTPISAFGATDQHSQMQLFADGPHDKAMILLEIKHFTFDYKLKSELNSPTFNKLKNKKLSQLMSAEFFGTVESLKEKSRPVIHLAIDRIDAEHLGMLIIYFETLTACFGHLIKIDPFNQPGVEAGKKHAISILESLK